MLLTTGRTVAHFLSGNQTRRIGTLVEQTPRPWVEVHSSLGFVTGDPVRVVTRRGNITFPALVTDTIRADTVFVPYHWAKRGRREPPHDRRVASDLEDPRIQGVRLPDRTRGRGRRDPTTAAGAG